MPAPLLNFIPAQFFTADGSIAASYHLFTYSAGTTNNLATYTDAALTSANANPIVLDSAGRATIFLDPALGQYKFVLKTTDESETVWTRDNILPTAQQNGVFPTPGTAGTNLVSAGLCIYPRSSDSTWIGTDADFVASSINASGIGFNLNVVTSGNPLNVKTSGRVTGLSGLTAGTTYYISSTAGALTSSAPTNKRAVGIADSTTSLIMVPVEAAPLTTGPLPSISPGKLTAVHYLVDSDVTPVASTGSANEQLMALSWAGTLDAANGQYIHALFWGEKAANANAVRVELLMWMDTAGNHQICSPPTFTTSGAQWMCEGVVMRTTATKGTGWSYHQAGAANTALALVYGSSSETLTNGTTWSPANANAVLQVDAATAAGDITVNGGLLWFGSV